MKTYLETSNPRLVLFIFLALGIFALGSALYIYKSLFRIRVCGVFAHYLVPFGRLGDRVNRHLAKIFVSHELFERWRELPFVGAVLIDRAPHLPEILAEDGLTCVLHAAVVGRQRDRQKDDHNEHRDHQFEQRKPTLIFMLSQHTHFPYHSLYFTPFSPSCSEDERTSNTFISSHDVWSFV